MNEEPNHLTAPDHAEASGIRKWERMEYQTAMVFMLNDGRSIDGHIINVSLSGVFMLVPDSDDIPKIGDAGVLHILPKEDNLVFPCQVVRVTQKGVGLNFNDKQAAFGMFVTHELMLDLLSGINNDFAVSLDIETTLKTSVSHIKNYLQSEAVSLFLLDGETDEQVCRACSGPIDITGTRLKPGEGVIGETVSSGITLIVQDVSSNSFFSKKVDEATGFVTQSLMCAPLKVKDKTIGALEVVNKRGSGLFSSHDRVVITALASATAMAIHNARQARELVEKEVTEKASKSKSEFISSMSHELRTPLNAILGFSQMLLCNPNSSLNETDRETTANIIKGGEHLLTLINEILDLARIESGKMKINIGSFDPRDMLESCVQMAKTLADENTIIFTERVSEEQLPVLYADEMRLNQVLLNLLSNAVKYTPTKNNVRFDCNPTSDGMIRFIVSDEGYGISKDKQGYLFEPFNRLGMEDKQKEGTGIGLTISKKLVELMDGRIGFESSVGVGSSFWVDIPTGPPTRKQRRSHNL